MLKVCRILPDGSISRREVNIHHGLLLSGQPPTGYDKPQLDLLGVLREFLKNEVQELKRQPLVTKVVAEKTSPFLPRHLTYTNRESGYFSLATELGPLVFSRLVTEKGVVLILLSVPAGHPVVPAFNKRKGRVILLIEKQGFCSYKADSPEEKMVRYLKRKLITTGARHG